MIRQICRVEIFGYLCGLVMLRNTLAFFYATLILLFSITCYSSAGRVVSPDQWSEGEELAWVSSPAAAGFVAQENSSAPGPQGWRSEVAIPGLFFRKESLTEPPRLKILRKIYVVDVTTYTSCKNLLLYPFHEFS